MSVCCVRKYLILGLVFWSLQLSAQLQADRTDRYLYDLSPYRDSSFQYATIMAGVSGYADLNSNAITNRFFANLLYSGAFIDDEMKDDASARMKDNNRMGIDEQVRLGGAYKIAPGTWMTMHLSQRLFAGGTFTHDGFNLVFYGNSMYAGKNAELAPMNLYNMDYYALSAGLIRQVNSKLIVAGELSFIRGGNYRGVKMERGTLYTDPDGEYLQLDSKFKIAYSDSSESAFMPPSSGKGLSVSFYSTYQLSDKTSVSFEFRDMGFIAWKDLNVYEGDSVYSYEGYSITDILDPNGSFINNITADSIAEQMGLTKKKESFARMLPSTFHLSLVHHLNQKWSIAGGVKYMTAPGYLPRVYVKPLYYFNEKFLLSPTVAYGGYGNLDLIVSGGWKAKNLLVSVDAFLLEYFLLPDSSSGNGLQFSVTGLF